MNITAVQMVHDVQALIDRYGIENVRNTINFLDSLTNTITWYNHVSGGDVQLTRNQYDMLKATFANGYGKISAIKLLREYTGIGLRDAKELVEKYLMKE